ncbi:hypothetical protein [Streptomyces sp. NPDC023838]
MRIAYDTPTRARLGAATAVAALLVPAAAARQLPARAGPVRQVPYTSSS